ncbi:signal peptidase I [Flammeovirga sp. EKP202]|uniref:signal peptidase I n=1 Tax=Flammeovirga sp. EKP202 TaxID=2770592 RepID=UPI001CB7FC5A|nr:signal peptidase I [Flammeovirga sp. EKP202]
MEINAKKIKQEGKSTIKDFFQVLILVSLFSWLIGWRSVVPTSSLEPTIQAGDHIIISKLSYGAITPATPFQLPLIHGYGLDWISLPTFRLPGFSEVQKGDIVGFFFPPEDKPVDLKTIYLKRCIATPGDTVELKNADVYINGQLMFDDVETQHQFEVITENGLSKKKLEQLDLYHYDHNNDKTYPSGQRNFVVHISEKKAEAIRKDPHIKAVKSLVSREADFYPATRVPKKGDVVTLTPSNRQLYLPIILKYEDNNATFENGKIFINGKEVNEYTVQQDYYFMMGDNRHNSLDSRFWGFVPADHIYGKGTVVLFNLKEFDSSRLFKSL